MASNPVDVISPAFRMEVSSANARTVVKCSGRLTTDAADKFKAEAKRLIERSTSLVLDCKELSYIDSAGVGSLVAIYTSAQKAQCDFRLLNLSQRVLDLFHITNLDKVFQGCSLPAA